ncbi:MAG: CGNR zinc finger domain-containing protein [Spirochaetes bacterium]|nr:CGNR zinc finger domain-containing protein [Spirochaetota bacterium]
MQQKFKKKINRFKKIKLEGGHYVLDFINTVEGRDSDEFKEQLFDFLDVLAWCRKVKLLSSYHIKKLYQRAIKNQEKAEKCYKSVIRLRNILYEIFNSLAENKEIDDYSWFIFNKRLKTALYHYKLIKKNHQFKWGFKAGKNPLQFVQYPLLKGAAELLMDLDLKRLKKCPMSDCGWLFLDISRNNSRKWCSMETCGNRAKAQRFYNKNNQ